MESHQPDRVGIEIQRDGSWRETVARYSQPKNLTSACIAMFDNLVEDGIPEAWAALRALDLHGCTDIIIDAQHLNFAKMRRTLT
jgi:hypothetical protein